MYTPHILGRFLSSEFEALATSGHFFGRRGALTLAEDYFEAGEKSSWSRTFCDFVVEYVSVLYLAIAHHSGDGFFKKQKRMSLAFLMSDLSHALRRQACYRDLKSYQLYVLIVSGAMYLQVFEGIEFFGLLKKRKEDVRKNIAKDFWSLMRVLSVEQHLGLHGSDMVSYDSRQFLLLSECLMSRLDAMGLYVLPQHEGLAEDFLHAYGATSNLIGLSVKPTIRESAWRYAMRHEKSDSALTLIVVAELFSLIEYKKDAEAAYARYQVLSQEEAEEVLMTRPPRGHEC
jgi:hypothetical protein